MVDCFDDFAEGCDWVSTDGGAGGFVALDVDGGGDAGGLCFSGVVGRCDACGLCFLDVDCGGDGGGLFSFDVDTAASNFAFSFTSNSCWIMLTALMPVFVKSGRAYHCLEVFSLWARTRRRMARSSGLQRSSICVVIIFLISTNAIRDPSFTPHFSMKAESLLPMVPSRNAITSVVIKRASSSSLAKSGRILRT